MFKKVLTVVFVALAGVFGTLAVSQNAMAAVTCPPGTMNAGNSVDTYAQCNVQPDEEGHGLMKTMQVIIDVVLGLIGLLAVIVIIIGGVTFVTSQGDAAKVTKGKNTILYGVIGLVVALLAFAIVNFALSGVFNGGSAASGDNNNTSQETPSESGN